MGGPMKVLIAGASGRTGRLVTMSALRTGHQVSVIVRPSATIGPENQLSVFRGDPLRPDDLGSALMGCDCLISALGSGESGHVLEEGATAMLAALAKTGVNRLLVVSQALLFPSRNPVIAALRWALAESVADSTAMEALVRGSAVD